MMDPTTDMPETVVAVAEEAEEPIAGDASEVVVVETVAELRGDESESEAEEEDDEAEDAEDEEAEDEEDDDTEHDEGEDSEEAEADEVGDATDEAEDKR